MYALVNVHVDNLTQLATTYSADEIAFVKRILDYIFDTNNTRLCEAMVISPIQAIQLAKVSAGRRPTNSDSTQNQGGAAQSLSMTQAETMMRNLVEEGWLEKSSKGNYSLTPRALMELRDWLRQTYNEDRRVPKIKDCAACKDIITVVRSYDVFSIEEHGDLTRIDRANDAPTANALDGSMTTAFATSSVCSRLRSAPCAT